MLIYLENVNSYRCLPKCQYSSPTPTRRRCRGHCRLGDIAAPGFGGCGRCRQVTHGYLSPSQRASAILLHRKPPCCHWLKGDNTHTQTHTVVHRFLNYSVCARVVCVADRHYCSDIHTLSFKTTSQMSYFGTSTPGLLIGTSGVNVELIQ